MCILQRRLLIIFWVALYLREIDECMIALRAEVLYTKLIIML